MRDTIHPSCHHPDTSIGSIESNVIQREPLPTFQRQLLWHVHFQRKTKMDSIWFGGSVSRERSTDLLTCRTLDLLYTVFR